MVRPRTPVVVMAFIGDDLMRSDSTTATCRRTRDGWAVSWIPLRCLDRNGAITAMVLAEAIAAGVTPQHRLWPQLQGWLTEIGLTEADLPDGRAVPW